MTSDEAKRVIQGSVGDEEPVFLPPAVLSQLSLSDLPEEVMVEVGALKGNVRHIDWDGHLYCKNGKLFGRGRYCHTRKYWDDPLGLPFYLDLVRRAIEIRGTNRGDVELESYDDDGAYIHLSYTFPIPQENLREGYEYALQLEKQIEETAAETSVKVGKLAAEVGRAISGWGGTSLEKLVEAVETARTTDEKGRALEELMAQLFSTIKGFAVVGRVRTATEEIDLSILNDSDDPRFRREEALLIAECKNWTGKCGKNEFVIFKEKIENRSERCSLGFLISWNGFAETVTKEMLRGSREKTLIVPLDGPAIRAAVRNGNFAEVLSGAWQAAVNL